MLQSCNQVGAKQVTGHFTGNHGDLQRLFRSSRPVLSSSLNASDKEPGGVSGGDHRLTLDNECPTGLDGDAGEPRSLGILYGRDTDGGQIGTQVLLRLAELDDHALATP